MMLINMKQSKSCVLGCVWMCVKCLQQNRCRLICVDCMYNCHLKKKELKCYISPASVSFLSEISVSFHVILGVCIFWNDVSFGFAGLLARSLHLKLSRSQMEIICYPIIWEFIDFVCFKKVLYIIFPHRNLICWSLLHSSTCMVLITQEQSVSILSSLVVSYLTRWIQGILHTVF